MRESDRHGAGSALSRRWLPIVASAWLYASQAAAAEDCARPDEYRALTLRALQTNLMVAALTCGLRPRYDRFILRNRAELQAEAGTLRGYFVRRYRAGGEFQLNAFVTRLANVEATRSNLDRAAYCTQKASLFTALESADRDGFDSLDRDADVIGLERIRACQAAAATASVAIPGSRVPPSTGTAIAPPAGAPP